MQQEGRHTCDSKHQGAGLTVVCETVPPVLGSLLADLFFSLSWCSCKLY